MTDLRELILINATNAAGCAAKELTRMNPKANNHRPKRMQRLQRKVARFHALYEREQLRRIAAGEFNSGSAAMGC